MINKLNVLFFFRGATETTSNFGYDGTEGCSLIIEQMKQAEGVTETMKADNQMLWVQSMNSIRNRAEEIIRQEMIYC